MQFQIPNARLLLLLLVLLCLYAVKHFQAHRPERTRGNLIYWKPHKTGSTSTKNLLSKLAEAANLTTNFGTPTAAYRFHEPTSLYEQTLNLSCTIHAGHIHSSSYIDRPHEAEAGVVITTTRNVRAYLVSRYFHLMRRDENTMMEFLDRDSLTSLRFWNFWMAYDACESMRYYDGVRDCHMDERALWKRAERIADRMDCVIDIDDAQADADGICRMMEVADCPVVGTANSKGGHDGYEELLQLEHLIMALERVERPGVVLRDALMKRRCRFLGEKKTLGRLRDPVWPTLGCSGA